MGTLPEWHKGKLRDCDICGYWFAEKELKRQRGLWVCNICYDSVTDEDRAKSRRDRR